ncbi:MAG TPA: signal peptidase I [Streptosporangiaceae bacterium]|nr:signal peptidase I [Streptosporangiaceae bacterium]
MARAADQEPETAPGAGGPAAPEPEEPREPAQPDDQAEKKPARKRRPARVLTEWVAIVAVALVLALAARQWVFQTFSIPSESMVPTLDIGDRIVVQKIFWSWHDIKQGDIVVFSRPPHDTQCTGPESEDLVKRVIALPGQKIYSAFGKVFVDGRPLNESYLPKPDPLGRPIPGASAQHPYRVPAGDFYVMGDNRAVSCDSRYWGPVQGSTIVGKVVLLLWRHGHPAWHVF